MKRIIKNAKSKYAAFRDRHVFSRASMVKDFVFAAIKIGVGIYVRSLFFGASGVYSICIGLAKTEFFRGRRLSQDLDPLSTEYKKIEYGSLAKMAIFMLAGSVMYVAYMARLFFVSSNFIYGEIPAITIAAVSFTELVLAIINLRRARGALFLGLRCVSLTSAFTALVLTQVAILSFAHAADPSLYNAISGSIFGSLCVVVALVMIVYYFALRPRSPKNP